MKTNCLFPIMIAALMSVATMLAASAQITVGGDGANTTDNTSYSGAQTLTKIGSNTVTLGVRSFYSGETLVEAGELVVVASGANFTPNNPNTSYVVSDGATLRMGSGSTWAALWGRPVTLNGGTLVSANQNNADALSSLTMNGGRVTGNSYRVYDGNIWNLSGTNSIETALGFVTFPGPQAGLTLNVTGGSTTLSGQMFMFLADGGRQFVQKTGAGTAVLTANNDYGQTRIQEGTLQIGNGGTTGSLGAEGVINNASLVFDRSDATSVGNVISGTGTVTQQGAGRTTFTANNTYSGGLVVSGGEAFGTGAGSFGTGGVTLESGRVLITRESNLTVANPIAVSADGTGAAEIAGSSTAFVQAFSGDITLGRDVNLSAFNTTSRTDFTGSMSGAGGVTVTGGRVLFGGEGKTYTGGTTVNAGTILQLSGVEMLPDAQAVTVNGTLHLASSGGTETVGGLSGAGRVEALLGGNYELVLDNADTANFAGTIANNAGVVALTKTGTGTQVLSGGNLYTGTTTISGGTLQIGDGGTTGTLGSGAVTNNATLAINRGNAFTLGNTLSGTGELVQLGEGTTTLTSGTTHTGGTTVSAGTLLLGSADRLADSGAVTVNGGSFNLGGFGETVGAVTLGGGSITNGTLTGSSYDMQSGTVAAVLAGSAALTKSTAGTVTLTGTNTYTGGTTVNAGELNVNGSIAGSDVTVASGASLSGSGTVGTISGAGAINPGNSPGILTAPSVDPSGGLSFNFEFTSLNPVFSDASASVNDVLRLTDATPFVASLNNVNAVNLYFNVSAFEEGQIYTGGFFTDEQADFLAQRVDATFTTYVADSEGAILYRGQKYSLLGNGLSVSVSTTSQSADFAGGTVNGRMMQVQAVPEPSTYVLLVLGAVALGAHAWRRSRRAAL